LPHPPRSVSTSSKKKEASFKFKLGADKRPDIQQNEHIVGSDTLPENDQDYVKVRMSSAYEMMILILYKGIC
jgi:hypothetical protein